MTIIIPLTINACAVLRAGDEMEKKKRAVFFAFSAKGCQLMKRAVEALEGTGEWACSGLTGERLAGASGFPALKESLTVCTGKMFTQTEALIYIGGCGIAVRAVAPYIKSKETDPAVLCMDELGHYVIPLLSGHIGGGNELAVRLAHELGAREIITTATDVNQLFSPDAWAAKQGMVIDSLDMAKQISAAILEEEVSFACDFWVKGELPKPLTRDMDREKGIYVSFLTKQPFPFTLRLVPKIIHLGIGCRKGASQKEIEAAARYALAAAGVDCRAVGSVASIDLKKREQGLLAFAGDWGCRLSFYSAARLMEAEGEFVSSDFVLSRTGVDNVCERAAVLSSKNGILIVPKTKKDGITVAAAFEKWEVSFE